MRILKRQTKFGLIRVIFGGFLMMLGMLGGMFWGGETVWAVDDEVQNGIDVGSDFLQTETEEGETADGTESGETDSGEDSGETGADGSEDGEETDSEDVQDGCKSAMGALGWLICPTTGKLAEAVDFLYGLIEEFLVVNPVVAEDGEPVYEIWKYCLSLANIMFIIFLLVVIYSQLTGLGISNYGIKKTLPKLIVTAVMVNLSFLICSLAVDASNIVGNGLTGLFKAIEESVAANVDSDAGGGALAAFAGGGLAAVLAGLAAFETGAIWLLIPTVLGAIVAVAVGFFTIALRQAVIILLVMIAPLAVVACILPNTEQWFKKWKQYLMQMLVFYPMFSLLFGASNLAGFAIMMSADSAFGVLLGVAVQIFPLFMAVKLMKMSGTFMGAMGMKVHGLFAKPLTVNRNWAESHRMRTAQTHLASNSKMPSRKLMQFMENRKFLRAGDTMDAAKTVKARGEAYYANSHYNKDGSANKRLLNTYERQVRDIKYGGDVTRHLNTLNDGVGGLVAGNSKKRARADALDVATVRAADYAFAQKARGAQIEYSNAQGRSKRFLDAEYAHQDELNLGNVKHRMHDLDDRAESLQRYEMLRSVAGGSEEFTKHILADGVQAYASQAAMVQKKFTTLTDLTPRTQDVKNMVMEMASKADSNRHIDSIVGGLRTINMRGDTDIVGDVISRTLGEDTGNLKVDVGSYSAQALSKFLMFDMKDSDPFIRRFGKYINLETAHAFNDQDPESRRNNTKITFSEYVNGEYEDYDEEGNVVIRKSRKDMGVLMKGTSFKGMERTALSSMMERIRAASVDNDGELDLEKYQANEEKIWKAIATNITKDHFTFASGSEQIMAFAKYVTGMDGDEVDEKGIFGKFADSLSEEQKQGYFDRVLKKRTNEYVRGLTAKDIADTKSDVLTALISHYRKEVKDENPDYAGDLRRQKPGLSDEEYAEEENAYLDDSAERKLIANSREEALKSFAKSYHRGYQSGTKVAVAERYHVDELYRKYFGKGEDGETSEEGYVDDSDSDSAYDGGGGKYTREESLNKLQGMFGKHNRVGFKQETIEGFWNEVKDSGILPTGSDAAERIRQIDELVASGAYTNTAQLCMDIEDLLMRWG